MSFRFLFILSFIAALYLTEGCSRHKKQADVLPFISRPVDTWVVRSVLDQKPRMLSIALHDKLWLAYNTQTGSLYKAWAGIVNFEGSVYTARHGVQPTTQGIAYIQEPDENPWRIIVNKTTEIIPEVNYKGHTILDNRVTLNYELVYKGQKIKVEERPEYIDLSGDGAGFERIFTTSKVPSGLQVALQTHVSSLLSEADLITDGQFSMNKKGTEELDAREYHTLEGMLILNSNSNTRFYASLFPKPAEALAERKNLTPEEAIYALIETTDCNNCHNKEVKTVGPSYMDIARQYDNTLQNHEMLVDKIIKGGAGSWGTIPMTPHPDLPEKDVVSIVSYILSLDAKEEQAKNREELMPDPGYPVVVQVIDPAQAVQHDEKPGIAINAYQFNSKVLNLPDITMDMLPFLSGSINALHLTSNDFGQFKNNFVIHATGSINLEKTTKAVFRLVSAGGSRLYIDGKLVIGNDGIHNLRGMESEIILNEGKHPFRIEYIQGQWQKGLSLQWLPYGGQEFTVVPPAMFSFTGADIKRTQQEVIPLKNAVIPGDTFPLDTIHPSFTLSQARPETFQPKVGGMDFLPDGRLVVSTWDSVGGVYILDGVQGNDPEAITVKRIAFGLAEPLGLKVVDGDIYVMQKHELTKLVDLNDDEIIDQYQTVCNGWTASANFHEFAFGLVYKGGYFYGTLATAIDPGGASSKSQQPDRGKVIKISKADGSFSFVASGLRTPNGIGIGTDNELFIADNQGDWLPANKIVHLQQDAWYGSRSVDFKGTANLTETQPVVYLTQDEISKSPSQPIKLDIGPYKNQMIFGDITHGGIKRTFVEKIKGVYQGAVFRFAQGLEVGVNRLVWGPDGALYVGGVGMKGGGWIQYGKLDYGLQKLKWNNKPVFEMLAVRAKANGVEIEFTEPLKEGAGNQASDYMITQWWFKPTAEYGGPKMDENNLPVRSIKLSADRRKVFLELEGMKPKHVVYIRLNYKTIKSSNGQNLWSTETWYTMNSIPD